MLLYKNVGETENVESEVKESEKERMGEGGMVGGMGVGVGGGFEGLGFLWLCVWAAPHVPH